MLSFKRKTWPQVQKPNKKINWLEKCFKLKKIVLPTNQFKRIKN